MSTGATLGPPPRRPFSMYGTGPSPQGGKLGANGYNGGGDSGKKPSPRVFQHIDDLLKAKPEVNIHAPIRRLLLDAESYSKQADTHTDFRRPDLALQDYMKASILVVDIIPRHKEYPDLKADRGELHRLYGGLQKRISSQYARFEDVKTAIKANNAESGVKPFSLDLAQNGTNNQDQDPLRVAFVQNGRVEMPHSPSGGVDNGTIIRTKPVVQPKPITLIGKSIINHQRSQSEQVNRISSPPNEDLESRFARLRIIEPQRSSHHLDPNPNSRPLSMPDPADFIPSNRSQAKPSGPRHMPKPPSGPPRPNKIPLDVQIPDMPRAPDAIYSPDRTNLDTRNIAPPRPATRTSLSDMAKRPLLLSAGASNGPKAVHKKPNSGLPSNPSLDEVVRNATSIKADDLVNYMKQYRILFVDIRSRADFDSGHIMSQSIICVEPIGLSENISANQLEERLVVSPDAELDLFRRRQNYDFVVYYDQSSRSNLYADATSNVEEIPLRDFSKAILDYDYSKQLKCPPKLLVGGLDAWVQLMGRGSLATSNTLQTVTAQVIPGQQTGTVYGKSPLSASDQDKSYQSRPLTQDEESQWETKLLESSDEFVGRFPDIETLERRNQGPVMKRLPVNSMTDESNYVATHAAELSSYEYKAPTRPQLAAVRPRYHPSSQGAGGGDEPSAPRSGWNLPKVAVDSISHPISPHGRTGLTNFGQTCYMNAVIQALSATTWFATYLLDGSFDRAGPPPRKKGEMSDPPQLMVRNLAVLMRHLWSGQYNYVKPQTLRNYIYRICSRGQPDASNTFGAASKQQDAQEFFAFLIDVIEDETNQARDKAVPPALTTLQESQVQEQSYNARIKFYWLRYCSTHRSPITEKFTLSTMTINTCRGCHLVTTNHSNITHYLGLNMPRNQAYTLDDLLRRQYASDGRVTEALEDVKCDKCWAEKGIKTGRLVTEMITRLPDTLVIHLIRHAFAGTGGKKNNSLVRFPLDDLDMTPYVFKRPDTEMQKHEGRSITHYRCYAVVQHRGETLKEGHFFTLVRDKKNNQWYEYNDTDVTRVNAGDTQDSRSYLLFYERIE